MTTSDDDPSRQSAEDAELKWVPHWSVLPPWHEVHAAVLRYDEEAVRAVVRAALWEPGGLARQISMRELCRQVEAVVGTWCKVPGAWWVSSETLDRVEENDDMIYSSPVYRLENPECELPRPTLDEAVGSVMVKMRAMVDCLRAFADVYAAVDRSASGDALSQALTVGFSGVFDAVIERFYWDGSWYAYATDGAIWLCDHLGVAREVSATFIGESVAAVCRSWTTPPPPACAAMFDSFVARVGGEAPSYSSAMRERAERIWRPRRTRAVEAFAAIEGVRDNDALEALVSQGLLPTTWLDTTRRAYSSLAVERGRWARRVPSRDARLFATLAADPEGVARAEDLAWEYTRRLQAWGLQTVPERLEWCVDNVPDCEGICVDEYIEAQIFVAEFLTGVVPPRSAWADQSDVFLARLPIGDHPAERRSQCFEAVREVYAALLAERPRLTVDFRAFAASWSASALWTALVDADARVPDFESFEQTTIDTERLDGLLKLAPPGSRLRDLSDPLGALIALWETGYMMYWNHPQMSTIVLFAPKLA